MNRWALAQVAVIAVLVFSALTIHDALQGPGHTCTLPCAITTGLQEDEVGYDYRHGGSVAVYRVTP